MIDDFGGVRKNESTPCCYCSAPPNTLNKRYGLYGVYDDRCYSTDLFEIGAQKRDDSRERARRFAKKMVFLIEETGKIQLTEIRDHANYEGN